MPAAVFALLTLSSAVVQERVASPRSTIGTASRSPATTIKPTSRGDWLVSAIAGQRLLHPEEEKTVTRSVHEHRRWRGVHEGLEQQLGRKPTHDEWSAALISGGEVALQACLEEAEAFYAGGGETATAAAAGGGTGSSADPSPADAEREFVHRLAEQEDAWRELIHCNLRLVMSIARRYTDRGMPLHDLVQEGAIGLMVPCAALQIAS